MTNRKKFLQRFAKDYNLPINVFDEEMFEYYKELYKDFFPIKEYNCAVKNIVENFDGNVEMWLDYYAKIRDNIIETVMSSDEYKNFNSLNLSEYSVKPVCGERSCYNEEADGKYFISIDLKKANFQALKYMKVLEDETYDKFIKRFGGDEYMANSKYLRQVVFGKMNPSRQITIEKYLVSKIEEGIRNKMTNYGFKLYSLNSDELIYEEVDSENEYDTPIKKFVEEIKMMIEKYLNIEVSVEYFSVERIPIVNPNGNKVDAYIKRNCITKEVKYKKISTTFFPQVYKLIKGEEITEMDRVFYFENQLATFNEPLRLE